MVRHGAALLTAAACALPAAGCGSGSLVGSRVTAAPGLRDLTPAPVGELAHVTWDLPTGEPTTLDPVKTGDESPNTVVVNLCDNLLQIQPDFSLRPGLARSWRRPNPRTLVLDIRPGVRFWDGHPLTAADVVFSMKRNLDPADDPVNEAVYSRVRSITQTGRLQVTVHFRAPDALFLDALGGVPGAVNEKAYVERVGKAYGTPSGGVMCTGPFRLVKWHSGQDIQLAANPHYWDRALRPHVRRLTFEFITDPSTLTSALLTGAVDGSYDVPLGELNALRHATQGTLYSGPSSASLSLGPTTSTGPAANPKVRRALSLAIDKRAFIDNLMGGAGEPLRTFTPPYVWDGSPARAIYRTGYDRLDEAGRPDLALARRLIAAAHVGHAPLTVAVASGDQIGLQLATIAQAAGARIGLSLRIRVMQPTVFSELFYDKRLREHVAFVATEGYIEIPSPLYYAPGFALADGIFNWSGYHDPRVTRDIARAQSALDPRASARWFVRAQSIFGPADLQISIATIDQELFMNHRLTGAPASFAYISSPWAARLGAAR